MSAQPVELTPAALLLDEYRLLECTCGKYSVYYAGAIDALERVVKLEQQVNAPPASLPG